MSSVERLRNVRTTELYNGQFSESASVTTVSSILSQNARHETVTEHFAVDCEVEERSGRCDFGDKIVGLELVGMSERCSEQQWCTEEIIP